MTPITPKKRKGEHQEDSTESKRPRPLKGPPNTALKSQPDPLTERNIAINEALGRAEQWRQNQVILQKSDGTNQSSGQINSNGYHSPFASNVEKWSQKQPILSSVSSLSTVESIFSSYTGSSSHTDLTTHDDSMNYTSSTNYTELTTDVSMSGTSHTNLTNYTELTTPMSESLDGTTFVESDDASTHGTSSYHPETDSSDTSVSAHYKSKSKSRKVNPTAGYKARPKATIDTDMLDMLFNRAVEEARAARNEQGERLPQELIPRPSDQGTWDDDAYARFLEFTEPAVHFKTNIWRRKTSQPPNGDGAVSPRSKA